MGRTRAFDTDVAVDQALEVFWRKGYEGTSLSDLTEALGINRPSLYAAFGNKEGLFQRALDRYLEGPGAAVREALDAPSARAVVERLLQVYADAPRNPERPRGCLLVQGALACSEESAAIRSDLARHRAAGEAALCARLTRAQAAGDPLPEGSPADLARQVWAVLYGMAVLGAGGASYEELRRVADLTLKGWPT
jgi:AcrR family transcriptional regulator